MELGFQSLGVVASEVERLKMANVVRRRSLWTMHAREQGTTHVVASHHSASGLEKSCCKHETLETVIKYPMS